MVQWMRNRRPLYKGGNRMEVERPSASYIIDVGSNHDRELGDDLVTDRLSSFFPTDGPSHGAGTFARR